MVPDLKGYATSHRKFCLTNKVDLWKSHLPVNPFRVKDQILL